ncbi:hypothetical protein [Fusibacter sp. JL216-2]
MNNDIIKALIYMDMQEIKRIEKADLHKHFALEVIENTYLNPLVLI